MSRVGWIAVRAAMVVCFCWVVLPVYLIAAVGKYAVEAWDFVVEGIP